MSDDSQGDDGDAGVLLREAPPAEAALTPAELLAVAQSSRDTVLVLDRRGRVVKEFRGFGPALGLRPGESADARLSASDRIAFRRALAHCREHDGAEPVTFLWPGSGNADDRPRAFTAVLRQLPADRIICIARDVTAQQATDSALARHYAVERLLRSFSTRFINVPPERIDQAIEQALEQIGEYCKAERIYLYQFVKHEHYMLHTHGRGSDEADAGSGFGQRLAANRLPWMMRQFCNRHVVRVSDLDMLPSEAHAEHQLFRSHGLKSLVLVPIVHSGRLQAFVGCDTARGPRVWGEEEVRLLTSAGEILAGALQRKQSEQRIFRLAYFDRLTGLPNRMLLRQRLRQAFTEHADRHLALVLLDLDDASNINDLLGHDVGDLLLKSLSGRLEAFATNGYPLGRWGGDEFLVTLSLERSGGGQLLRQVHRLRAILGEPVRIAGHELRVSSSVGIACYPRDAATVDELFRYAEMALRQAKQQGRAGLAFYERSLERRATYRSQLETRLRLALERQAFELRYQPLVLAGDTSRVVGAEALLRWHDEELGSIPPDEFIDVAEDTGLIVPLGDWALEQACADLAAWRHAGLHMPRVSVNVSGHQLLDDRLPCTLERVLRRYGLPPNSIDLEITETTLMEREKGSLPLLQGLRDLGVGIAVDDFGTGYSSLSKIKHLPVTVLKIDRSFVQDIFTDDNDKAIIIAIVAMAHQLQLRTVAEGVETQEQLAFVRDNGCDLSQGFLHSGPCSAAELRDMLETRSTNGAG